MSRTPLALAFPLVLASASIARAQPEPSASPPAKGFALEVQLGTGQTVLGGDTALPATQAGLFLGYHLGSVTVGVGFDVGRIAQSQSYPGGSSDQAATTLVVMPGVRVVAARSRDGRTELLGQLDAGLGATWFSNSDPASSSDTVDRLRFQVGPSLQHWVSPSFAVGATAGVRYDRMSTSSSGTDSSLSNTALFSTLQVMGVF